MALPSSLTGTTHTHGAAADVHGAVADVNGAVADVNGAAPDVNGAAADAHGARATRSAPADSSAAWAGTEDRGSFTHGTCGCCGWSGPGRRARATAARDAVRHLQLGCTERVTSAEANPDGAP
jgi:hypothetical protein